MDSPKPTQSMWKHRPSDKAMSGESLRRGRNSRLSINHHRLPLFLRPMHSDKVTEAMLWEALAKAPDGWPADAVTTANANAARRELLRRGLMR